MTSVVKVKALPSLSLEEGLCHDEHALIARDSNLYLHAGRGLNKPYRLGILNSCFVLK